MFLRMFRDIAAGPQGPDPRSLLAEHAWLRRLARSLVDEPGADDLAQDVVVAALEQRPATRDGLRPWLARVARRLALQRRRRAERRHRRELAAAREEATPSTADVVERAQLHGAVVEATLALGEPYRTTLLLRFYDDLPVREVARRCGVPLETVRTRLRRGLHRLRTELDEAAGGRREAWLSVATSIALPPATATFLPTTLLMSMQAKLATAGAIVVLAGGLVLWRSVPRPPTAPTTLSASPESTPQEVAPSQTLQAEPRPPDERVPVETTSPMLGELVGLLPHVPFTGVVRLEASLESPGDKPRLVDVSVVPDAEGAFAFELAPWLRAPLESGQARTMRLTIDDPRYLAIGHDLDEAELIRSETQPLRLPVTCAGILVGRVVDAEGRPLAAAAVSAHPFGARGPEVDPVARAKTDIDGSYRLMFEQDTDCLVMAYAQRDTEGHEPDADPSWQPGSARATATTAVITEVPLLRLEPGLSITGRVTWSDGTPVADARIHARTRGSSYVQPHATSFAWLDGGRLACSSSLTRADDDGRFELRGLSGVPTTLSIQWVGGDPVVVDDVERTVIPPARADIEIDAVQLAVTVTDGARRLDGANVKVRTGSVSFMARAEDGRQRLILDREKKLVLVAEASGHLTEEIEWQAPPGAFAADLEIALRPRITHDVTIALDSSIEQARFVLRNDRDEEKEFEPAREDGAFVLPDVAPGEFRLSVARLGPRIPDNPATDSWLVEDSRPITVPTPGPIRWSGIGLGGRVLVRCTTTEGRFLAGTCEVRRIDGEPFPTAFTVVKTGSLWVGGMGALLAAGPNESSRNLPPGEYLVRVTPEGHAPRERQVTVRARAVTPVEFVY